MTDKEQIHVSEVGSMEEVLGENDSLFQELEADAKVVGETKPTVTGETVDLTGSQEELTGHKDLTNPELYVEENITPEDFGKEEAKPKKDIPAEYTIEYLINLETKNVFPVNEDIVRQKHLVPCTKEGKILPDNRRPSDFR